MAWKELTAKTFASIRQLDGISQRTQEEHYELYKGYIGKVAFDADARLFHGEVVGIRDVVTFQGQSVTELEAAFKASVDDYLAFCRDRGEEPDKPCSGLKMAPTLTPGAWSNNWRVERPEASMPV